MDNRSEHYFYYPGIRRTRDDTIPAGSVLLDGGEGCTFHANTLLVVAIDSRQPETAPQTSGLQPVVRISGLLPAGAQWSRTIALTINDLIEIDVSYLDGVRVELVQTVERIRVFALTTDRIQAGSRREISYLAVTYAAGIFGVPNGASAVRPTANDPGFNWLTRNLDGSTASVPDPLFLGVETDVFGAQCTVTVPNTLVWRIVS